jgi:imidazolonepropionase-like amidohydrolase
MSDWDLLLTDARIATMRDGAPDYGVITGPAAIAIHEGKIVWIG